MHHATFRPRRYDPARDREAAHRIWREVGWLEADPAPADVFLSSGRAWVADLHGEPECMVNVHHGQVRYIDADLPLAGITGVTTSRVARRRGLARALTAHAIADAAEHGAAVALLGVFEQGFYNSLGFGNGAYEILRTLDPAEIDASAASRAPVRIDPKDWEEVHAARGARRRGHGACSIDAPELTRAEMLWSSHGFGLGYRGSDGAIGPHVWCSAKDVDHGPYRVEWMVYRTREDFLELLALLHGLGDQVRSIRLREPPGIQLQDLLRRPFRTMSVTERSRHENRATAAAYWQVRILDLERAIAAVSVQSSIEFALVLTDPIADQLPPSAAWRGLAGSYIVSLGSRSSVSTAEPGMEGPRPILKASINAFSRLWFGVRPAVALSWTDDLSGPPSLIEELDRTLCLPVPFPDWDL